MEWDQHPTSIFTTINAKSLRAIRCRLHRTLTCDVKPSHEAAAKEKEKKKTIQFDSLIALRTSIWIYRRKKTISLTLIIQIKITAEAESKGKSEKRAHIVSYARMLYAVANLHERMAMAAGCGRKNTAYWSIGSGCVLPTTWNICHRTKCIEWCVCVCTWNGDDD